MFQIKNFLEITHYRRQNHFTFFDFGKIIGLKKDFNHNRYN